MLSVSDTKRHANSPVVRASLHRRDRLAILAGLGGIVLLSWGYLFLEAVAMGGGSMDMVSAMNTAGARLQPWSVTEFLLVFIMWAVMMVAMMVPSATPMILLFAGTSGRRREAGESFVPTGIFLAGYVVVWTAFSLAATALQYALTEAALVSPMMVSTSRALGGVLLLLAGIYQWTPLKEICLKHCRSPMHCVMTNWRPGRFGAFEMGLRHGAFCVGCCWALMALLFVGGVMNLLWVAAIAFLVLIEKVVPRGDRLGRLGGLLLAFAGLYMLFNSQ